MDGTGVGPPDPSGKRDQGSHKPSGHIAPPRDSSGKVPNPFGKRPPPGAELGEAVRAFCETLQHGDLNIQLHGVRFDAEAIELTLGLALVREPGSTRLVWRVRADNNNAQHPSATHAVTIRLVPG